ncbi:MAG: dienelactone hydrolase family protein [Pseudomonadota bacterium]
MSAPNQLDGPRLPPRSGVARSLLVLLHGYGADGRDLMDLAHVWSDILPDTAFVAPHAPDPCGQAPVGRQWFALDDLDLRRLALGVEGALPMLDRFLDAECTRWGVAPDRLALAGFSQGTMMALGVMSRRSTPPAAVIGFSGLLAHPPAQGSAKPCPVCLIHGTEDSLVPPEALFASAYGLAAAGIPAEWHLCPGLGHGIDARGLSIAGSVLADALAPKP